MEREQLEHLIRAIGAILSIKEWIVVGSQSILGEIPDAPAELKLSMEADLYSRLHPDRSDLIEGVIGEDSSFHVMFGYYARGVSERTATLPKGWEGRLIKIENDNTNGIRAYCIAPHDMAASKLYANREKDCVYLGRMIRYGIMDEDILRRHIDLMPVEDEQKAVLYARSERLWRETRLKPAYTNLGAQEQMTCSFLIERHPDG